MQILSLRTGSLLSMLHLHIPVLTSCNQFEDLPSLESAIATLISLAASLLQLYLERVQYMPEALILVQTICHTSLIISHLKIIKSGAFSLRSKGAQVSHCSFFRLKYRSKETFT